MYAGCEMKELKVFEIMSVYFTLNTANLNLPPQSNLFYSTKS